MNNFKKKIVHGKDASGALKDAASQKEKIVLCYGHFNVIHPGHIRFLEYAEELGEKLVVAVWGDKQIPTVEQKHFFSQEERANGVAALHVVNSVVILDYISLEEVIPILRPAIFLLGKEFEEERAREIDHYISLVEENGGRVLYSSGEIHYASTDSLFRTQEEINEATLGVFHQACKKNNIDYKKLYSHIKNFSNLNMLVLGDTIVDQYIACDALGMSAEAPILAIRELESKEFIGGAAIVACHMRTLGAQCHYLSVIGDDTPGKFIENQLNNHKINVELYRDQSRPTTFKIRYMVNNQKILRVSRLQEHSINKKLEDSIIRYVENLAPSLDGIIFSDFVYGIITKRVLQQVVNIAKKNNVRLFGDLQCSSQIGNVCKFNDFDLITPTEREARIALSDQESGLEKLAKNVIQETQTEHLLLTLGSQGFIAYQTKGKDGGAASQHFPALNANPVDVTGAGDTLLATMAASLCAGSTLMEASAIGCCTAAIAVNHVGNIPITANEIEVYLEKVIYRTEQNGRR